MRILPLALAAGALLTPAEELSSRYVVGEVRRTEISFEDTLTLIEMTVMVDGEEIPEAFEVEQEDTGKGAVTFEDRILKLEGGELDAFERRYVELGEVYTSHVVDPLAEDYDERQVLTCALEGKRVLFSRDDAGESFFATYPEGEVGDPELLEGITTELPWVELLSDGEVAAGGSWKIEPELFELVMRCASGLPYEAEVAKEELPPGEVSIELDEDGLEENAEYAGEITATWKETESIDEVAHARIEMAIDFTVVIDLADPAAAAGEEPPDDLPPDLVMPEILEMQVEEGYQGQATLLWDLEVGRLVSMEIELELEEIQQVVMLLEMEEGDERMEQTTVSEGTFRMKVTVTDGKE